MRSVCGGEGGGGGGRGGGYRDGAMYLGGMGDISAGWLGISGLDNVVFFFKSVSSGANIKEYILFWYIFLANM